MTEPGIQAQQSESRGSALTLSTVPTRGPHPCPRNCCQQDCRALLAAGGTENRISFFRYLVEHAFSEGTGCPPVLTGPPAVALAPAVGGTSALPLPSPFSPSGSPGLHLSRCLPCPYRLSPCTCLSWCLLSLPVSEPGPLQATLASLLHGGWDAQPGSWVLSCWGQ